ncbi:hypothetical protein [Sulfitobacter sabulilitoris]|uniref:DnaA N-terminal domain-containing protein n=1 Tax=Sulfitobacter sabulilitoris TaxID=2562655 RepID=A0A5S3P7H6_9RHOB|nr:hypothetical protein [Sulfitobacter sabulilitoris]TMM49311.1 hypothetical protein FDT80_18385 [Sulfitobacter sabulilitoris]
MEQSRLTGALAGSLKYDLLTALTVMALHGSPTEQTTALRLAALVTARYNWKLDEFCVGQRDMARMWNVNERTVKREVRRMIERGLIVCRRQGVRGRVGAYRLNMARIAELSRPTWPAVGADFVARMDGFSEPVAANVVKFDFDTRNTAPDDAALPEKGTWRSVLEHLARSDPANLRNWYAKLSFVGQSGGVVTLRAPSRFVGQFVEQRLSRPLSLALEEELGPFDRLLITC